MRYAEIIPVLVKAVQEQQVIIETQETRNKNLQAQLDEQVKINNDILNRLLKIETKN